MYFFYYMPVGIDVETRRFPVMTVFFSVLCAFVFATVNYFPDATPFDFNNFIYYPGFSGWPAAMAAGFLHYGWVHLIGNLLYLLLFGWYLEDRMGTAAFSFLFLGSSLVGNLAQGWYNIHILHVHAGIIGASGAVSGILGAFLVRFYLSRVKIAYWVFLPLQAYVRAGRVEVPIVFALILWMILQVARGLVQYGGGAANVAYVTHIVGFLVGILYTLLTGGWREARAEAHRMRARRYLKRGEYFGAQDELARYVAGRPDEGEPHAELARVQVLTGDDLGARANYLKACEILLHSNDRAGCEAVFEQAVRGYPDFVLTSEPHLDLAFGLERNLKHKLALTAYENFARRYPRHRDASFTVLRAANLYAKTFGDTTRARQCYETFVDLYPDDVWLDFAREQLRVLA
jgi:membrane associated rhomboid family serine protease